MGKKIKLLSLLACAALSLSMVACNPGSGPDTTGGRGKVTLTVWAVVNENNNAAMKQVVNNFNETNENYRVNLVPKTSGYSAQLGGTLKGSNPPNVVQIDDRYYKGYIDEGYLTCLDEYFVDKKDENGNVVRAATSIDLDNIWDTAVTRFRYDPETGYSGEGQPLYGMPTGITPGVMYYNATALKSQGVNIISVAEDEIEAYNEANSTSYLARGYYVYDTAPAQGLSAKNGKYYVFNNRIPMSWEELVEISTYFTRKQNSSSPTTYGFFNEWWFSFGWSVGGDCLEWDEEKDQYVFALGEATPNYLVTGDGAVTINGTSYAAGDILSYSDKHYVEDHKTDTAIAAYLESEQLYALPSIRDAFTLFLQLSQTSNRNVTADKKGLEISPTPNIIGNKSKLNLLTSKEVAFVVENYSEAYSIGKSMAGQNLEWDIAPLYQYREYNADGTLKTVNGTPVMGKRATHSGTISFAIPANSKSKDGAFQFIEYMASKEVQELLMESNLYVPVRKDLVYSDAYMNLTGNYIANNKNAIIEDAAASSVGDWSYLENGQWVNIWANVLNTDVRNGVMTLDDFFNHSCVEETNNMLKTMHAKKYNG